MTNEEAIKFLELEKESTKKCWDSVNHEGGREYFEKSLEVLDMAMKALEQEDVIGKIEEEINSPNRGTCDYFIVDRIEEIINKYKAESEEV